MNRILVKRPLNETVTLLEIEAPLIAKKVKPGQFVILRSHAKGERIPLTVADHDADKGSITVIFQKVGKTTLELDTLEAGAFILDLVGPLGNPTHLEGYQRVAVVGGGVGCAIAYPEAKALYQMGAHVTMIAGFRNRDLMILEEEMTAVSQALYLMTDDGSNGHKGFVTDCLKGLLEQGTTFDLVLAIGPLPMMRAVANLTREYGVHTIVSMNPIMIDGTGMCGCCRLTVNGETKFACVDGPDFDAHQVDFEEAMNRASLYRKQENHSCNLYKGLQE